MISKEMSILEIMQKYPQTQTIFSKYNMSCSTCMGASFESLEMGVKQHGIKLDELMNELNKAIG